MPVKVFAFPSVKLKGIQISCRFSLPTISAVTIMSIFPVHFFGVFCKPHAVIHSLGEIVMRTSISIGRVALKKKLVEK